MTISCPRRYSSHILSFIISCEIIFSEKKLEGRVETEITRLKERETNEEKEKKANERINRSGRTRK